MRSRLRPKPPVNDLIRYFFKRGSLDGNQDASEITSRRICYCVGTHLLLRWDVANAASGRNFRFLSWL